MAKKECDALVKLTALREIRKKQSALGQQKDRLLSGLDSLQEEDNFLLQYKVWKCCKIYDFVQFRSISTVPVGVNYCGGE
jgi:hypothetical protein